MAAAVYESRPPLRRTTASDATRRWIPDVFVKLQLHAHRQLVRKHPFGQDARMHHAVYGRHMNRRDTRYQLVSSDDVTRVFVVPAILDDELHLVMQTQPFKVGPIVLRRLAAAGTLDVEDRDDGVRNARRAAMASRFQKDGTPAID